VYLESQERLQAYLGRLHTLAGERPVVMSELGLDSRRNGEHLQARTLDWQVRSAFAGGCAGAFVYAWTDEWYRSGEDVRDWDFGVTRRDRRPKPALSAVRPDAAVAARVGGDLLVQRVANPGRLPRRCRAARVPGL